MLEKIQLIPHAQNSELRLQLGKQQTSFTLMPGRAIPAKTLAKIEKWCLEHVSPVVTAELLTSLRQLPVPLNSPSRPVSPKALPNQSKHLTTRTNCTVVCDYSAQESVAVWACVIGEGVRQILCCGPVPDGEKGEHYAVLRTHHYLQRLGYSGTILSDEKATAEALSRWYPVRHIDRGDARHRVAHHLAHNFALLLVGKPVTGPISELQALTKQVWPQASQADFIRLAGQDWQVALAKPSC